MPLDWGMGHTTRCIPIIQYLQSLGHIVTFAGDTAQCALIKKNLVIKTVHIDGYNITYSKSRTTFSLHILRQVPRILSTIQREHAWLLEELRRNTYDAVITDNRYGLCNAAVPTVIITHQLRIHTGMGNLADHMLQKLHYRLLRRFGERWVVDVPGEPNMAGTLSHPEALPQNTHYIGLLSQLEKPAEESNDGSILVLLSGPEPQRTILSGILWQQAATAGQRTVFVEGKASAVQPHRIPNHIEWHAQLNRAALQQAMGKAAVVICRAGYSTIMDLIRLNKKAVLIPTPGQAEQEYLGKHLSSSNLFCSCKQKNFNLARALAHIKKRSFTNKHLDEEFYLFKPVIDRWLFNM